MQCAVDEDMIVNVLATILGELSQQREHKLRHHIFSVGFRA